jgi:hypothetical protein
MSLPPQETLSEFRGATQEGFQNQLLGNDAYRNPHRLIFRYWIGDQYRRMTIDKDSSCNKKANSYLFTIQINRSILQSCLMCLPLNYSSTIANLCLLDSQSGTRADLSDLSQAFWSIDILKF